jgi:heat shock protein HtpX
MVTMTLLQGVMNTFVIFLSRVVGFFVDRVIFKTERGFGPGYFISSIVAQILLGILANMVVMWFSRYREFRADDGGASLSGRGNMIAALKRLQGGEPAELPAQLAGFGISGGIGKGLAQLFRSHPPLEDRIRSLQQS